MMVDFALDAERNEGKSPDDAIYQACLLRFRPIMMTTMAALLGALPLAMGHGVGSELRRPLGISIVGGLIFSQILTLYTTPVIYLAFDRLAQRWGKKRVAEEVADSPDLKLHEHLGSLHKASGRHHAAYHWAGAGRGDRLPSPAGVAAAQGGFPDHLGFSFTARS